MKNFRRIFVEYSFILLAIPCSVIAQSNITELGPSTLRSTESFRIKSVYVDQTYEISVSIPQEIPFLPISEDEKLPVVYVLDGGVLFGTAALTSNVMRLGRDVPPIIIVGVDYYFEGKSGWGHQGSVGDARMRDFTLSKDPNTQAGGGVPCFLVSLWKKN